MDEMLAILPRAKESAAIDAESLWEYFLYLSWQRATIPVCGRLSLLGSLENIGHYVAGLCCLHIVKYGSVCLMLWVQNKNHFLSEVVLSVRTPYIVLNNKITSVGKLLRCSNKCMDVLYHV
jgi:hypothetical protein